MGIAHYEFSLEHPVGWANFAHPTHLEIFDRGMNNKTNPHSRQLWGQKENLFVSNRSLWLMTFEEIQKTIEGMLAVQKELQQGQLRIQESQARDREQIERMMAISQDLQQRQIQLQDSQERERETILIMVEEMNRLMEISNRHERRIEQLIGYSITNDSDHLNLEEKFRALEQRVERTED